MRDPESEPDSEDLSVPAWCAIHQHHKWCEHNGGVRGLGGFDAPAGGGGTLRVWVYDDPASGIEIAETAGIGTEVEIPAQLLERFRAAQEALEEISDEVAVLLDDASRTTLGLSSPRD